MTLRMATVEYSSGHKCVDNGSGDYELICPDYPNRRQFTPYMSARNVLPQKACPHCLRLIGRVLQ